MRIHSTVVLGCALLVLSLAGCSSGSSRPDVELVPVEGVVTLGGEPLAGASVMFGGVAMGETDAEGRYELSQGTKKGVPVGEYQVVIEKWVMPDGSLYRSDEGISPMDSGATQEIPPKYSNMEMTELKATVPAGGGKVDFELKKGK